MAIFTEKARQEEPDILAIDKEGDLYIFELKRWSGKQENLLQVLRYGQLFGKSTYDELNCLYQKYQHNEKLILHLIILSIFTETLLRFCLTTTLTRSNIFLLLRME